MAKKLLNSLSFVLALMLLVSVVSSILTITLTGYAVNFGQNSLSTTTVTQPNPLRIITLIKANSCDADNTCEVTEQITTKAGSKKGLVLTSDIKTVAVKDQLHVKNVVIKDNIVTTNGNKVLVLSSSTGSIIIEGNILAPVLMDEGDSDSHGYVCVSRAGVLIKKREPCV